MEVLVETEANICVITVQEPRIDAAVALAFKEAMRKGTDGAGASVILNLEHVTFIDSSGLGALVATLKHLLPERALILAGMTPTVQKVFELTRMDTVFRMFATRADAARALER
jgi:anti-sigma B factor antagonist